MCSCISPMASRILSFKASIVSVIFDGTPQILVQRYQIVAARWPNNINSAADNAILKNRVQNIECSFGCVARSAVLLKPNIANILLFNFSEEKFFQYGPVTIAIDCNGLSLHICEEKWPNYATGPKSAPNSNSFWVRRLFNVCMRVFYAPNAIILLVYITAKIKMSFIWNMIFFAKSVAALPYVAHTLSYSFGGKIKIIICQIKHEFNVTIHEISTIWKKR